MNSSKDISFASSTHRTPSLSSYSSFSSSSYARSSSPPALSMIKTESMPGTTYDSPTFTYDLLSSPAAFLAMYLPAAYSIRSGPAFSDTIKA